MPIILFNSSNTCMRQISLYLLFTDQEIESLAHGHKARMPWGQNLDLGLCSSKIVHRTIVHNHTPNKITVPMRVYCYTVWNNWSYYFCLCLAWMSHMETGRAFMWTCFGRGKRRQQYCRKPWRVGVQSGTADVVGRWKYVWRSQVLCTTF